MNEGNDDEPPIDISLDEATNDETSTDGALDECNDDEVPTDISLDEATDDDISTEGALNEGNDDEAPIDVSMSETTDDEPPIDVSLDEATQDEALLDDLLLDEANDDEVPKDVTVNEATGDKLPFDIALNEPNDDEVPIVDDDQVSLDNADDDNIQVDMAVNKATDVNVPIDFVLNEANYDEGLDQDRIFISDLLPEVVGPEIVIDQPEPLTLQTESYNDQSRVVSPTGLNSTLDVVDREIIEETLDYEEPAAEYQLENLETTARMHQPCGAENVVLETPRTTDPHDSDDVVDLTIIDDTEDVVFVCEQIGTEDIPKIDSEINFAGCITRARKREVQGLVATEQNENSAGSRYRKNNFQLNSNSKTKANNRKNLRAYTRKNVCVDSLNKRRRNRINKVHSISTIHKLKQMKNSSNAIQSKETHGPEHATQDFAASSQSRENDKTVVPDLFNNPLEPKSAAKNRRPRKLRKCNQNVVKKRFTKTDVSTVPFSNVSEINTSSSDQSNEPTVQICDAVDDAVSSESQIPVESGVLDRDETNFKTQTLKVHVDINNPTNPQDRRLKIHSPECTDKSHICNRNDECVESQSNQDEIFNEVCEETAYSTPETVTDMCTDTTEHVEANNNSGMFVNSLDNDPKNNIVACNEPSASGPKYFLLLYKLFNNDPKLANVANIVIINPETVKQLQKNAAKAEMNNLESTGANDIEINNNGTWIDSTPQDLANSNVENNVTRTSVITTAVKCNEPQHIQPIQQPLHNETEINLPVNIERIDPEINAVDNNEVRPTIIRPIALDNDENDNIIPDYHENDDNTEVYREMEEIEEEAIINNNNYIHSHLQDKECKTNTPVSSEINKDKIGTQECSVSYVNKQTNTKISSLQIDKDGTSGAKCHESRPNDLRMNTETRTKPTPTDITTHRAMNQPYKKRKYYIYKPSRFALQRLKNQRNKSKPPETAAPGVAHSADCIAKRAEAKSTFATEATNNNEPLAASVDKMLKGPVNSSKRKPAETLSYAEVYGEAAPRIDNTNDNSTLPNQRSVIAGGNIELNAVFTAIRHEPANYEVDDERYTYVEDMWYQPQDALDDVEYIDTQVNIDGSDNPDPFIYPAVNTDSPATGSGSVIVKGPSVRQARWSPYY